MQRFSGNVGIVVVVLVVVLFFGLIPLNLPPVLLLFVIAGVAWATLQAALQPWRGRRLLGGGGKETYWRGQRIVIDQPRRNSRRLPPPPQLAISIFYFVLSVSLWIVVIRDLVRVFS